MSDENDLLSSFESDILSDPEDDDNVDDIDLNFTQGSQDLSLPAIENDNNNNNTIESVSETVEGGAPPLKRKRISCGENGNFKRIFCMHVY